jgi:hypothetical protein
MKLSDEIIFLRQQIDGKNKQIEQINNRITKLQKIEEKFPSIAKSNGLWHSPNVKISDITCMSLDWTWDRTNYNKQGIVARFAASPAKNDKMKIHWEPIDTMIAEIERTYNYQTYPNNLYKSSKNTSLKILIKDYESVIPQDMNRRKLFIKRIKRKLKDLIVNQKAEIHPDSFNKEYFEKMLMLV